MLTTDLQKSKGGGLEVLSNCSNSTKVSPRSSMTKTRADSLG